MSATRVSSMDTSHAPLGTFPAGNIGAMPAFLQRSLVELSAGFAAAWRRFTVADFELQKATQALRQAKSALLVAEAEFDRDCGANPMPLISSIRFAEAQVEASRAALRKVDPRSTE